MAIALHGEKGRTGMVIRIDLPPPCDEGALATVVAGHMAADDADQVLVVVHTDEADLEESRWPDDPLIPKPHLPRSSLFIGLLDSLQERGISLHEALLVRQGRWWSYACGNQVCCPPDGKEVAAVDSDPLAAATAWSGRVILDRREDLAAVIGSQGPDDLAEVRKAITRQRRRMSRAESAEPGATTDAFLAVCRVEAESRRKRWRSEKARDTARVELLDVDSVAVLLLALAVDDVRDECLAWCVGPDVETLEPLWLELTRRAPPRLAAAPATLLAVTAYLRGDGAFARECLQRAVTVARGYRLAGAFLDLLDAGVPPWAIAEALREEFEDPECMGA